MLKAVSIARTTAHEILSEPLSLLVTVSSLALAVMAPVLHYHQFGEATRMARDAGFSSLFIGGIIFSVFGVLKTFRRELETGTADMALAHSVSRKAFFLSKVAGAVMAFAVFAIVVSGVMLLMVEGAVIGGRIADSSGGIARIWGPCVAAGSLVMVLPLLLGALLNRFARFRFVLTFQFSALVLSVVPLIVLPIIDGQLLSYVPAIFLVSLLPLVLMCAAAAFAVRLRSNAAVTAVGMVALAFLPAVGNYYLVDALARGGTVGFVYVLAAFAAILPAMALFLLLGMRFLERRGQESDF